MGGATPLELAQEKHADNAALLALLSGERSAKLPGTVCDRCAEPGSVFCAACGGAVYCSAACVEASQAEHGEACAARQAAISKKIQVKHVVLDENTSSAEAEVNKNE